MAKMMNDRLLRHLAGEFSDDVADVFGGDHISQFLTATSSRQHVWYLWLSFQPGPADNPAQVREKLLYAKSKSLIEEAVQTLPVGCLKVLNRLPLRAMKRASYSSLVAILEERPAARKVLLHDASPDERLILTLTLLPEELATPKIVSLLENEVNAAALAKIAEIVTASSPNMTMLRLKQKIESCKDRDEIYSTCEKMLANELVFPEPPFNVSEFAAPLETPEKIREAGVRYQNCLSCNFDYAFDVASGCSYFYEWKGSEPAIIQLKRDSFCGWQFEEVKMKGNEPVSIATMIQMGEVFGIAPVGMNFRCTLEGFLRLNNQDCLDEEDINLKNCFVEYMRTRRQCMAASDQPLYPSPLMAA